jgi:hypothetical protein
LPGVRDYVRRSRGGQPSRWVASKKRCRPLTLCIENAIASRVTIEDLRFHMHVNLQILQITLQALSSFAIAGGLIFTAIQFRHAQKAQAVANFSKLVELQYQLRKIRVDQPSLASVHHADVQHLHSDREIQEYFLNLMQLSLFEIAWYAHKNGQLPDDYFSSWTTRMWQVSQEDSFRRMLNNPAMKIMHDEFDAFVRRLADMSAPPAIAQLSR